MECKKGYIIRDGKCVKERYKYDIEASVISSPSRTDKAMSRIKKSLKSLDSDARINIKVEKGW